MRVAFVVHRYGTDVIGGAEHLCRQVAEHMAKWWTVDVLTTCARSYVTWENEHRPGEHQLNGVTVRRFPVDAPRDQVLQDRLAPQILPGRPHPRQMEIEWMRAQGPYSTPLLDFLAQRGRDYDACFFYTYLYCTTYFGLPLVSDRALIVPTAHDEPWLGVGIFREVFEQAQGLVFLTPEERDLVLSRFAVSATPNVVTGIGMEPPPVADGTRFRKKFGIHDPFIAYLGRIDESKGCRDLIDFFLRGRWGEHSSTRLVLIGPAAMPIPDDPRLLHVGVLDEQDKQDALSAAEVLVQSSPFESLSIVILEAWLAGTPVLVNGRCAVLRGQCRRSQGGLWYENEAEFGGALAYLLDDPVLRRRLAANGRRYVELNYSWERIEDQYRDIAERVLSLRTPAAPSGEKSRE